MATQSIPAETSTERAAGYVSAADRTMNAVMIASGVGSAVLGLLVVGADANAALKTALTWDPGVGPLAGKAGVAAIAFLVSWVALHFSFQKQSPRLMTALIITGVLVAIGVALTFPPIYMPLAHALSGA